MSVVTTATILHTIIGYLVLRIPIRTSKYF